MSLPTERTKSSTDTVTLPVIEETADIVKDTEEAGTVVATRTTRTRSETQSVSLDSWGVEVERTAIGRVVDSMPEIRTEDDYIIVPVVEERVEVVRRLVLVEEVRLHRRHSTHTEDVDVSTRHHDVAIHREEPDNPSADSR